MKKKSIIIFFCLLIITSCGKKEEVMYNNISKIEEKGVVSGTISTSVSEVITPIEFKK